MDIQHIWKGAINAEKYKQVLEHHASIQRTSFFRKVVAYFSKMRLNCTVIPLQQCGFIVAFLQFRPLTNRKYLLHHEEKKSANEAPEL